jgi:hypothetical protein
MQRLLDADAAADMPARENSGFSVDASVRITLIDRDVPSYFRSLEHLTSWTGWPISCRRGWGRSFLLRARDVVATSDSSRSLPIQRRLHDRSASSPIGSGCCSS